MKIQVWIAVLLLFLFNACKENEQTKTDTDTYYTCSMHPQVVQNHSGNCPICHMELIAVKKQQTTSNEIVLTDEQMQLGNIKTDTIQNGCIENKIILTGTVVFNQSAINSVSARITGRIDRLYFQQLGASISLGQPLFDLYSETLNNAKQEYVQLYQQQHQLNNSVVQVAQLLQSAKNKLLLWGMTEQQISSLLKEKKISPITTFYSNVSGVITELPVVQGQYITEGATVLKVADLSTIWVEAQVYAANLSTIRKGTTVNVQFPDFPGLILKGKINFINPEMTADTRVVLARIALSNVKGQLKPGMPAYVITSAHQQNGLMLPLHSVLQYGNMNIVWIQTAYHTFQQRMVQTGTQNSTAILITKGLKNGDVVVTNGTYLLNSEAVFKHGDKMQTNMPGMDMHTHER